MTKSEARKHYRELRKALTQEEVLTKSKAILSLLFSRIPVHSYSIVHVFLPIEKNNEPDTHFIIETLQRDFPSEIYISKSLENGEMLHTPYSTATILKKNKWGIEEPTDLSQALTSEVFFENFATEDILVLIPLLAFDKQGNRVGYGKGYYDRFLSHSGRNCTKMGISLLEPVGLISDADPHDIKMDCCITPERIWKF